MTLCIDFQSMEDIFCKKTPIIADTQILNAFSM